MDLFSRNDFEQVTYLKYREKTKKNNVCAPEKMSIKPRKGTAAS
jgi:hypothetical protein